MRDLQEEAHLGMAESPRQRYLLVIEDDQGVARVLQLQLEHAGFAVHTEHRGASGLTYALDHELDLVILDLKLPDMGGYDVAKELRKSYHRWSLPILMLTGMDRPIDQLRGFAHGADAYLTKPYDAHELIRTVTLLLGEATAT